MISEACARDDVLVNTSMLYIMTERVHYVQFSNNMDKIQWNLSYRPAVLRNHLSKDNT